MKRTILAAALVFPLVYPASVLAQEQSMSEEAAGDVASGAEASATVNPGTARAMPGMGMVHQAKGHHGKGHGGMKHGGGHHEKHRQVVQRLDMIEARLAKIEAMLEILMRR